LQALEIGDARGVKEGLGSGSRPFVAKRFGAGCRIFQALSADVTEISEISGNLGKQLSLWLWNADILMNGKI
jgi:hypothetical protein